VSERRGEIGLCSALGAGRRHIRYQFLTESVLLSAVGGIAGVAIGVAVTVGYALSRGWETVSRPVRSPAASRGCSQAPLPGSTQPPGPPALPKGGAPLNLMLPTVMTVN
jgi:ABC-type antimicrobial peptide transport system permease subunit